MSNYKQKIIHSLGSNGLNLQFPENTTLIYLHDYVALNTNTDTMRNIADNTNYQVPTGFTLHVVWLKLVVSTTLETCAFYNSTTVDGTSGGIGTWGWSTSSGSASFTVNFLITEDNFFCYNPSSTGVSHIEAIGYLTED